MKEIILMLILILLPYKHDRTEMLFNAYSDYQVTEIYVLKYGAMVEANPVARFIFEKIEQDKQLLDIAGSLYLIFLAGSEYILEKSLLEPYNKLPCLLARTGHFYGAMSWGNKLNYPVRFTINIEF